jgi:hypothetical protein
MIVPVILVALAIVIFVFLFVGTRKRRDSLPLRTQQATPVKSASRFVDLTAISPFKRKKPFAFPANPLNEVTVRDPTSGMKASGHSHGGALAKLEGMTGRKINNPQFGRK